TGERAARLGERAARLEEPTSVSGEPVSEARSASASSAPPVPATTPALCTVASPVPFPTDGAGTSLTVRSSVASASSLPGPSIGSPCGTPFPGRQVVLAVVPSSASGGAPGSPDGVVVGDGILLVSPSLVVTVAPPEDSVDRITLRRSPGAAAD